MVRKLQIKMLKSQIEKRCGRICDLESQLSQNVSELKQTIEENKKYFGELILDEELAILGLKEKIHLIETGENLKVAY